MENGVFFTIRMIKHFFIPENSFSFKIFKKLKNLIKK